MSGPYWLGTACEVLPPANHAGVPKAVFLITPEQFSLAEQSAQDNRYMQMASDTNPERAKAQCRGLQLRLSQSGIPCFAFAGRAETPDAHFPNNVFATAPGRLVLGAMRHPVRQRELARPDILSFFRDVLGYRATPLTKAEQHGSSAHTSLIAELTGSLVIDRARNLGWCGLSERCTSAGAVAMHDAFNLRSSYVFELAAGEYHTNVVLSALAGRGLVLAPDGIAEAQAVATLHQLYDRNVIVLDANEKANFAGNCIALTRSSVWMSERACDALRPATRTAFEQLGFSIVSVPLDEIEKAGGSLRCMIGEVY